MDESHIVALAQQSDQAAFALLVERYQTPVYNLAYRMLGNPNDADDAAQEAFLRAYARLKQFRAGENFTTWLLAIAAHYCIDQLRRRRFQWLSLEENAALAEELTSDAREPDAEFLRREDQRDVEQMVKRLAPANRLAVVLYYWYDLPLAEIARMTGETEGAVKVKLHRVRRALAKELSLNNRQPTADVRRLIADGVESP